MCDPGGSRPVRRRIGLAQIDARNPRYPATKRRTFMQQQTAKDAAMRPWPKGIQAITLFVQDLAAAKQFYQEIFGLPVHFEDPNSAVFKFGNTLINLLKITEADELIAPANVAGPEAGSRMVFTIEVEDVDAMCAELTARGVVLLNGPMDRPWGIRTASFSDPGGHNWEIAH
jgi:catechol 2,3-dioxygenase-like lactoylglutathione lyase family enzyme